MRPRVRYLAGRRVDVRIRRFHGGSPGLVRRPVHSGGVTQSRIEIARVDREFDRDAVWEAVEARIEDAVPRWRDVRLRELPRFLFLRRALR